MHHSLQNSVSNFFWDTLYMTRSQMLKCGRNLPTKFWCLVRCTIIGSRWLKLTAYPHWSLFLGLREQPIQQEDQQRLPGIEQEPWWKYGEIALIRSWEGCGKGEEYRPRNDKGVRRSFWIYQRAHKMPLKTEIRANKIKSKTTIYLDLVHSACCAHLHMNIVSAMEK